MRDNNYETQTIVPQQCTVLGNTIVDSIHNIFDMLLVRPRNCWYWIGQFILGGIGLLDIHKFAN